MANSKFPLGRNAKAYYNTSDKLIGDTGVETVQLWLADNDTVEAPSIRNMALDLSNIDADTNTRGNTAGGYNSTTPVLKNAGHTFDSPFDETDAFIDKLVSNWDTVTKTAFAMLNRDKDTLVSGDKLWGWAGNCGIGLTNDQEITDVQRVNFTVNHQDEGQWYRHVEP